MAKSKKSPAKPPMKAAGAETSVAPTPVVMVPPVPEPTIQPESEPPVRPPDPPKAAEPIKGFTPEEERMELEKQIASLQARLWELDHPIVEFPKMVTPAHGPARTFNSHEEQDAAGPDYADKK